MVLGRGGEREEYVGDGKYGSDGARVGYGDGTVFETVSWTYVDRALFGGGTTTAWNVHGGGYADDVDDDDVCVL